MGVNDEGNYLKNYQKIMIKSKYDEGEFEGNDS